MRRVLVIAPHPDDEAIGVGGMLRRHAAEGDSMAVVFLTSGEAGGHGVTDPATRREREAERAAEILGLNSITFWRLRDSRVRVTDRLVSRLSNLLESTAPHLIYVPHPLDDHPDHRAAARLLRGALRKGVSPHEVREYEVWTPLPRPNVVADVTAHMDVKIAAIRAYESQCDVLRFDDAFLGLARYRGEMLNWPDRGYAEVFRRTTEEVHPA